MAGTTGSGGNDGVTGVGVTGSSLHTDTHRSRGQALNIKFTHGYPALREKDIWYYSAKQRFATKYEFGIGRVTAEASLRLRPVISCR